MYQIGGLPGQGDLEAVCDKAQRFPVQHDGFLPDFGVKRLKVPVMIVNAVSDIIMQEENTYVYRTNLGDLDGNNSYMEFLKFMMGLKGGGMAVWTYW